MHTEVEELLLQKQRGCLINSLDKIRYLSKSILLTKKNV